MALPYLNSPGELAKLIDEYFDYIEGEYHLDEVPAKETKAQEAAIKKIKVWEREPEPATMAGLALYLGFDSRQAFDDYCASGQFRNILNQARLRIEAFYEKKLHNQSATGAIFALKSLGWNEKTENKAEEDNPPKTLKIELIVSGPKLADNEKDVVL